MSLGTPSVERLRDSSSREAVVEKAKIRSGQGSAATPADAAHLPPRYKVVCDLNSFVDWLHAAPIGGRIIYYRGLLAPDLLNEKTPLRRTPHVRNELRSVADRVLACARTDTVMPVQKRIGDGDFLYIAVKARDPHAGSWGSRHD